jgi:hypothetical protein
MTTTKQVTTYDIVELTEPVDDAPAGARGGVLELYDDGKAMIEITSLPGAMDIDRIVIAPVGKLRLIDAHSRA